MSYDENGPFDRPGYYREVHTHELANIKTSYFLGGIALATVCWVIISLFV